MSAVELLGQAQQILATRSTGGLSSRLAAFLARQALEEIIDERCALSVLGAVGELSEQAVVLRALDSAEAADRAAVAWNRLSNACHLHAFEMQPSTAEIEHLCGVVAELLPSARD